MQASILRQIVAGPRLQHPEAGLDLCYVTDNIIATSGPSSNYPQRAYRNPLDALVNFLDSKHDRDWCIWEFRAEGTGYPDSEVYGRIHHYPWPDHHPPPFALIPAMMGSMRNWLNRLDEKDGEEEPKDKGKRVAVVHCKAGKGRSGTVACSYLISQEGWKLEDALQRFTERRMRVGFGAGVSIPSQLRWVRYVDRWANHLEKKYVERPVEILELHVWGLKDGVKVAVEGFVDEGKTIKCFHLFHRSERTVVDRAKTFSSEKNDENGNNNSTELLSDTSGSSTAATPRSTTDPTVTTPVLSRQPSKRITGMILRPSKPLIIPSSDVNIDFERRSKAPYTGFAMVTSIAHIWFNPYFEGGDKYDSGVFEAEWEAMDGIKGSTKKGVRALDRLKVVWRYPPPSQLGLEEPGKEEGAPVLGKPINVPKPGEPIPESHPADWHLKDAQHDPERPVDGLRDQENIPTRIAEGKEHQPDLKGLTSESEHPIRTGVSTTAATAASATAQSIQDLGKELGLRKQTVESKDVSLANSEDEARPPSIHKKKLDKKPTEAQPDPEPTKEEDDTNGDLEGVQPYFENKGNGEGSSGDNTSDNAPKKS
ncbi:hypothetical protein AWENTII_005572 [Aspergillus wentii]|nr:hypothetical protein MW887_000510 [Aspergillus wentii]